MHLIVIFILLFSTLLSANIYDEYKLSQDTNKSKNYFFSDDFDEIIRFDAIVFEDDTLSTEGTKTLKKITQKINSYKNGKTNFFITVIGHTSATIDDENENKIDSNTYANKIQNIFRDSFDANQSAQQSQSYAEKIKQHLIDNKIDEKIIELEYRKDLDPAFSNETQEGKKLSNRVMVSLYIEENLDLDNDGVVNSRDFCPKTKEGMVVDIKGCKFKSIILLAENGNKYNAIEVTTKRGSRVISTPRDYTLLKSKYDTPRLYKSMPDKKMKAIFSDVLESSDVIKFLLYFNSRDFVNEDENLFKIIDFLFTKEDAFIQIIGHTDTKGSSNYNAELAQKRAEAVAQKIKESGVNYLYMDVESYGEYNPAVKTNDGVNEAQNRRVEVLIR